METKGAQGRTLEAVAFVLGGYLGLFFAFALQKVSDAHSAFEELFYIMSTYQPLTSVGPSAYQMYVWSLAAILTTAVGLIGLGTLVWFAPRLLPRGSRLKSAFVIFAVIQFFVIPVLPVMTALAPPNSVAIAWGSSSNLTKSAMPTDVYLRGSFDLDSLSTFVLFVDDYMHSVTAAIITTLLLLSALLVLHSGIRARLWLMFSPVLLVVAVAAQILAPLFSRIIPDSFIMEVTVSVSITSVSGSVLTFSTPSWMVLYDSLERTLGAVFGYGSWVFWAACLASATWALLRGHRASESSG
jgi:hypothetical protein